MGQTAQTEPDARTGTPAVLNSLGRNLRVAVFGASGGIGSALVSRLSALDSVDHVYACARQAPDDTADVSGLAFDLGDEDSIAAAAARLADAGELHAVFVTTGILHSDTFGPEKRWRDIDADVLTRIFAVNAVGPALIAKHVLGRLARDRKSVFCALSARVGSVSDNVLGGWHGYRASKAALNMFVRTMSIELAYRNPHAVCFSYHPGTVNTALSAPFQRNVPETQLTEPQQAVEHLLAVTDGLSPDDSGGFFAWDGKPIPF